MNYLQEIAIIIPSLEPDEKLLNIIKDIKTKGFNNIIIVNDGSKTEYDSYYSAAKEAGCILLKHAINMGKGRALKTALNYIICNTNLKGAVTVDSDGQHCIEDIDSVAEMVLNNEDGLVLGARDFSQSGIPLRSKVGNVLTAKVITLLCGIKVKDTQTGLRGFGRSLFELFLSIPGERFEYEMNMLLAAKEKNIEIQEIPIKTVYLNDNETSHFNPLKDSIKIYTVFLKFILSSISSFVIDILLFTVLTAIFSRFFVTYYIGLSTVIARVVSSLLNYNINKKKVFGENSNRNYKLVKYFSLCIVQMCLSAICVTALFGFLHSNLTVTKMVVDSLLFIISFQIQREWVFK